LLLEPALAKLAAASGSNVTLATRPGFAPMLALMENVQPLAPGLFRRASKVISFGPRPRAGVLALSTRAPEKRLIVLHERHLRPWHSFVFTTGCRAVSGSGIYRARYFFDVMPVKSAMAFRSPRLCHPPHAWLPQNLPERYVLIHTTSAWPEKSWTAEAWAQTLDELHRQGMGPFVITGGNAEWELKYVADIERACSVPLINLCGKTSLDAYLAVVANAEILLGIDGSSAHLASAFGVPALTLFGASSRKTWHYPSDTSIALDASDFTDTSPTPVAAIPVEAVVQKVKILNKS
jgi:hypothetical protein